MDITIFFEIPQLFPFPQLDISINGQPLKEGKWTVFNGKRMLFYRLTGFKDPNVILSLRRNFGPTHVRVHLLLDNGMRLTELVGLTGRQASREISIPVIRLMTIRQLPSIAKRNSPTVKKRFRSTISFGKEKPVRPSDEFEHYREQQPPEELLTPKKDADKNILIDVFYFTDRQRKKTKKNKRISYSNRRGVPEMGVCQVNIPANKKKGEIPRPNHWLLEFTESEDEHMMIMAIESLEPGDFFSRMQAKVQASPEKDAFLFVHGYNVSFTDSVLRAAQIAKDINFRGAPIVYSWPSRNLLPLYTADEATATGYSLDNMINLLKDIRRTTGAQRIHLIAHSMGNRFLTEALRALYHEGFYKDFLFNQIILAAPDIDAQVFVKEIAPKIAACSERVTLYASKYDVPLYFSGLLHGNIQRAGQSSGKIAVIDGMDTVDASKNTTGLMGHGYFAENKAMIDDIFHTTRHNHSPEDRNLKEVHSNSRVYWEFE